MAMIDPASPSSSPSPDDEARRDGVRARPRARVHAPPDVVRRVAALPTLPHRAGEDPVRALLAAVCDGACVVNELGRITAVNGVLAVMAGIAEDHLIGAQIPFHFWPDDERSALAAALSSAGGGVATRGELRFHSALGGSFPATVDVAPISGGAGAPKRSLCIVRAATPVTPEAPSLAHGAGSAPLRVVGASLHPTERRSAQREFRSVRDHLRVVTDSIGEGLYTLDTEGRLTYINHAGEDLLGWRFAELAGQVMHERVHFRHPNGRAHAIEDCPISRGRREGRIVRVDGDTFVRKDGTDLPVAYTSAPFETPDGVSGSVVVFRDITAQREGEARLQRQLDELFWAGQVREALVDGRFTLFAQPIVDVATGATLHHELLIRMRQRDGSLVGPGLFLPAAEAHGAVVDVDRWVLRRALGLARRGYGVHVNLSVRSIAVRSFVDELTADLEQLGAAARLVVLELTETAVADDQCTRAFLTRVRALGCEAALDDFGTGYGAFRYLKRLPVDYLKIDQEFIRDLATDAASSHVVRAVVTLARSFGQRTVAEGVEDPATMTLLRAFGVDRAQGYALGRPAPVEDIFGAPSGG